MPVTVRVVLGLCALLGASILCSAGDPFVEPVIEFGSFKVNKVRQAKGTSIRLTAVVTIPKMGNGDEVECGFENENQDVAPVNFAAAGIRFKGGRINEKAEWYITEERNTGEMVWSFKPEGYALTQGKTYTMRAVAKLSKNTQETAYNWKFFCLAKNEIGLVETVYEPDWSPKEKEITITRGKN